jgi:DSHCT (NUC185) domain
LPGNTLCDVSSPQHALTLVVTLLHLRTHTPVFVTILRTFSAFLPLSPPASAELMFNGCFHGLDKHQLLALVSCLVPTDRTSEQIALERQLAGPLAQLQVRYNA